MTLSSRKKGRLNQTERGEELNVRKTSEGVFAKVCRRYHKYRGEPVIKMANFCKKRQVVKKGALKSSGVKRKEWKQLTKTNEWGLRG